MWDNSKMDHSFWGYSKHVWGLAWKHSGGDVRGIASGALIVVLVGVGTRLTRGTFDNVSAYWTVGVSVGLIAVIYITFLWRAAHQNYVAQHEAITVSSNTAQANRIAQLMPYLNDRFNALGQKVTHPFRVNVKPMDEWNESDILSDEFRQTYKLVRILADCAGLKIKNINILAKECILPQESEGTTRQEVEQTLKDYSEGVEFYAARAKEELQRLTNS